MAGVEQLITDNLDIWSSAIKNKASTGRGSSKKVELYGIKKLRELILEFAVRGLLVPQDPNDEPASILLEKIDEERKGLIQAKKLKKEKPHPKLSEEEKPFSLPLGWEWERFGNIYTLEYGNNLPKAKRSNTGEYPVYGSNGIVGTHSEPCITARCIVVGRKGSAGALNLSISAGCWVTDVAYSVVPPTCLNLDFVFRQFHTLGLGGLGKGIKPGLNRNEAYVLPVAIPPVAEQIRIVAKVNELMTLCDQLEQKQENSISAHQTLVETLLAALTNAGEKGEFNQAWARIVEQFDTLFTTEHSIDQLKQTILQLAVMGKLVPQDPNDEPASELLKRIAAEKEQLIKDKKIKKQKPLPPLSETGMLFKLPESWMWVNWGDLLAYDDYAFKRGPFGSSLKKSMFVESGYKVYEQYCPINDDCSFERYYITPEKFKELEGFSVKAGDYLVSCSGVTLGRITQVPAEFKEGIINQAILRVRMNQNYIDNDFFKLMFRSPFFQQAIFANSTGSAIPNVKGVKELKIMPVPLIPLSEQKLIVAKVNQLQGLCDQLKARLSEAQITQLKLADSVASESYK